MKPKYVPPVYEKPAYRRSEAVLSGAGGTLLVIGFLVLAVLLLGIVPAVYDALYRVLGSNMEELRLLTFLAQSGGAIVFGVFVGGGLFAVLLSRTPRPGLALFLEGLLVVAFVSILITALTLQSQQVITGLIHSLDAATKTPVMPIE